MVVVAKGKNHRRLLKGTPRSNDCTPTLDSPVQVVDLAGTAAHNEMPAFFRFRLGHSSMLRSSARMMMAALLLAAPSRAVFGQPGISNASPGAVAPGKTTEIALHGTKLDGTLRAWTSFPAQIEFAAGDSTEKNRKQVVCKLSLSAGVP